MHSIFAPKNPIANWVKASSQSEWNSSAISNYSTISVGMEAQIGRIHIKWWKCRCLLSFQNIIEIMKHFHRIQIGRFMQQTKRPRLFNNHCIVNAQCMLVYMNHFLTMSLMLLMPLYWDHQQLFRLYYCINFAIYHEHWQKNKNNRDPLNEADPL